MINCMILRSNVGRNVKGKLLPILIPTILQSLCGIVPPVGMKDIFMVGKAQSGISG